MVANATPKCDALTFDPRDSSLFVGKRREVEFARLRQSETLHVESNGVVPIYSLVRYTDVERAYKEPDVFSPCAGLTLDSFDPAQCKSPSKMLEMAPTEQHRALRSVMQKGFRGSVLAETRERIEDQLERFLATAGDGAVEFVAGFARAAASTMMALLLGLSATEAVRLAPALQAIGDIDFGESSGSAAKRKGIELLLLRELTRAVRGQRNGKQPDGLIEMLLEAEVEGRQLSEHEVALNCFNVAVAGTGASQHTLAGTAALWADHPAGLDAVADDPKLARRLVDETLRWLTPVIHLTRILTADVDISGQRLPKGAGVCLWNISANRDEEIFEDAGSFRPDRPPGRNLAFGAGPQYCLGAEVVRTQLDALLAALLRHGLRPELAGPPTWMPSNAIAGVESLPIRLRRHEL